jgi:putative exporter of polyketide antibiotics
LLVGGDENLDEGWSANLQTLVALLLLLVVLVGVLIAAGYGSVVTDRFADDEAPQASFRFSYDRASERLTVTHVGGESVPGQQLVVRSGNRTVGNFSAYETVSAGDAIVVEGVTRPEGVAVVWVRPFRTLVLATWPR